MGAGFYLKKGIRFKDYLKVLDSICHFRPNPNGAPLGEEPTRHDDFIEAGCMGWIDYPGLLPQTYVGIGGYRLRPDMYNQAIADKWNPEQDSLIHRVSFGYAGEGELDVVPGRYSKWPQWMSRAGALYRLYKQIFIELRCDQAEPGGESEAFFWDRSATHQKIMVHHEMGIEITEDLFQRGGWQDYWETRRVFPELCEEG